MLSPDSELRPVGDKSGIPYAQFYRDYKKHLMLRADKPDVQAVFALFQSESFAGVDPSVPIRRGTDDHDYEGEFDDMFNDSDHDEPELISHMSQLDIHDKGEPQPLVQPQTPQPPVQIDEVQGETQAPPSDGDPQIPPIPAVASKEPSATKKRVSRSVKPPAVLEQPVQTRRVSTRKAGQKDQ